LIQWVGDNIDKIRTLTIYLLNHTIYANALKNTAKLVKNKTKLVKMSTFLAKILTLLEIDKTITDAR